jgi:hypothetical protein
MQRGVDPVPNREVGEAALTPTPKRARFAYDVSDRPAQMCPGQVSGFRLNPAGESMKRDPAIHEADRAEGAGSGGPRQWEKPGLGLLETGDF